MTVKELSHVLALTEFTLPQPEETDPFPVPETC